MELNVLPLEKLLCPFSATTMAFAVFELLLKRNCDLKKQTQSNNGDEVPEGEVGIVEHIAGFVLFNLKKQAKRINNVAERELVEDCLNALETPEVVSTSKTNLPSLTQRKIFVRCLWLWSPFSGLLLETFKALIFRFTSPNVLLQIVCQHVFMKAYTR